MNTKHAGKEAENVSVTARIDPKLKYILNIISTIDDVSLGELLERAFWGSEGDNYECNDKDTSFRVEEFKSIVDYISNQKVNISARVDKKLYSLIDKEAEQQNKNKITIIENALWEYVEKEGFERDPVTEEYIKINIELPGRFKEFSI